MGQIKNTIFENNNEIKPTIYASHVDDIFLEITSEEEVIKLKKAMESIPVLKFTYELNKNKKLPFLDVLLDNTTNLIKTSVYRKKKDKEQCFNYNSKCMSTKIHVCSIYIEHTKLQTHGKDLPTK